MLLFFNPEADLRINCLISIFEAVVQSVLIYTRPSAEKFPEGWATEKIPKISKKDRKIALLSLFQRGGDEKKTEK